MARILIVEDDKSINKLLQKNLELVGHYCACIFDGGEVFAAMERQVFDLILLDVMLPGWSFPNPNTADSETAHPSIPVISGFDIMEELHEKVPVIFLTARSAVADRVKGLRLGADDYIVKPFDMTELLARVDSVLRRRHKEDKAFELGSVRVDLSARKVFREGRLVDFTPQEFALIEALIRNRNIALSRDRLLSIAWGYDYGGDTRTVDVHIHGIRKKLCWEDVIKTVYKVGYRLEAEG